MDVTNNDQPTNGDLFEIETFTQPPNGTVTLIGDNLVYEPYTDFTGTDSFTYTICDNDGCDQATVTVMVLGECTNPDNLCIGAFPDNVSICVEFCDLPDAEIVDWHTTFDCSIENEGNNCLHYLPLPGFTGNETVIIRGCNGGGFCDTVYVHLTVGLPCGSQTAPVANNDNTSTPDGTPVTIDVTANDNATDGDPFNITTFTQPPNGTVTQVGDDLVYTPDGGFTGTDTFTYTICDDDGCDEATVTVTVANNDTPPVANNDNGTTTPNTPISIDVTANDQQTDGDLFNITTFTQPTNGTVTQVGDNLVYTPDGGFTGTDNFTYTICDNDGCDQATVTITVTDDTAPPPCPPIANDDYVSVPPNTSTFIYAFDNDVATDGDAYYLDDFTQPSHGTVSFADNHFIYTPTADYLGTDNFTYTLCDDDGCDQATVYLYIEAPIGPQPCPPIANDDYISTPPNTSVTIDELANDAATDGDPYFIQSFTQPAHGTVTMNADSNFVYTPNNGYIGTDNFTYTLCDDDGCDQATVYLYIEGAGSIQSPPIANNDNFSTPNGEPITVPIIGNDVKTDGDDFTIEDFTQPTHGTLIQVGDQLIYTPNGDYTGDDSFIYTICDNDGCSTATVYINVYATCINPDNLCIGMFPDNVTVCVQFCDVPDAVITGWHTTFECSIQNVEDNCLLYTPLPGFATTETLTFYGCNAAGQCDTVYVHIIVGGPCTVELPPIANNDNVSTPEGTPIAIDATANDQQTEGDAFSISTFTQPSHGTVIQVGNNFTYTPTAGFTGLDSFNYTICDDDGCSTAIVFINVTDVSPAQVPPIAVNDNANTTENTAVTIEVTNNDLETNGDAFQIQNFTQPSNGTVIQVGDDLIYTPQTGFTGTDSFTYTICDNDGCDEATVTVTVTDDGQSPPIAVNDNATVTEYSLENPAFVLIPVTANDIATDGDAFSISSFTQPSNGGLVQSGNDFVYTPQVGFTGTDSFTYTICDDDGCDQATVTITVTDNGEVPPIAVDDQATTSEATAVTIPVTSNDMATNGDSFTISTFSQPTHGTVTQVGTQLIYVPQAGFTGTDSFIYSICDDDGCDQATVTVTVTNDGQIPPIAVNDNATTTENTPVTI